jgi:two-component sensor histidine kinase/HAMP domain-containing protein
MSWRFADLPVRTKFLVTLGIPVLGMVLLIGKQVDSNIKRSSVYTYIKQQSERIGLVSNVLHELQRESSTAVEHLTGRPVDHTRIQLQQARADAAISALNAPGDNTVPTQYLTAFTGLTTLRQRVLQRQITATEAAQAYRTMDHAMLDEVGRVQRLALDADTKDRMYAHLRLLNAKEALSTVRLLLGIALQERKAGPREMGELSEQVAQYETNMLLFERDAPPDVMGTYRDVFRGPEVNFMRSVIGTVKEHRMIDRTTMPAEEWWDLSNRALDRMKLVEDRSLELILQNTAANSRDARFRLLVVLAALIGVVGAVLIMGLVLLRGVSNTVNEVTHAARSLARGDVSAAVPVNSTDEIGQMALSFNGMIDNIRALADSAGSIGKGNYDTPVPVRGPQDVLGNALARMKENLKAARIRDNEQATALRAEKVKLEQANERIQVLIKEMHHRVKNNLQVIASLLRLQAGTIADERLQHAFDQSQSRVTSMALIHERLYKGDELAQVDVAGYLKELFAELVQLNDVDDSISYSSEVDADLTFDLATMVPLGLLFNELITNSFKHAFVGRTSGNISLSLHRVGPNTFDLVYQDDGVGIPTEKLQPDGPTLGISLIDSLVQQLNGRISVDGGSGGTTYHIRFSTKPA